MTPLAIAFTPNYIVPAAAMLKSLLDASSGEFEVICLVTEDIPAPMRVALQKLGNGRLSFRYIPLKGRLKGIYTDPRYTEAASFRLLLPELLPEYDSILYIDCDVIVRQDVGKLFRETTLGDNYLAAVYEAPIEGQAERFLALGCDPNRYFNSGFLLINLARMRSESVSQKLLDACRVPYLEFPDQDALNQVCQGRVLPLSPVYNGIRTFFLPQYKECFCKVYPDRLWKDVQEGANIHYTGGKPWNIFSVQFGEWWKVYYTLPKEIQSMISVTGKIKILSLLYKAGVGHMIDWVLTGYRSLK